MLVITTGKVKQGSLEGNLSTPIVLFIKSE